MRSRHWRHVHGSNRIRLGRLCRKRHRARHRQRLAGPARPIQAEARAAQPKPAHPKSVYRALQCNPWWNRDALAVCEVRTGIFARKPGQLLAGLLSLSLIADGYALDIQWKRRGQVRRHCALL